MDSNSQRPYQIMQGIVLNRSLLLSIVAPLFVLFVGLGIAQGNVFDQNPASKEKVGDTRGDGEALPIDQTNWTKPQSSYNWIAMAREVDTPWESYGRSGWLTDDAYVIPVDPGVSEFPKDTEIFYIVFAISPLDAPSQYRAAWYYLPDGKTRADEPDGTDALMLEMNEKSGYLEVFQPEGGWKVGQYLLRLFFESPGQELYDPNVVGTMKFTITE
ncbi:MAG: hypothetical protein O7F12_06460 [Nitrospirae bacterium]|nr:hypothetical protein [Nitrospirota bacterium]